MKTLNHVLRFILGLLLLMPTAGALGLFPEPSADMYSSIESWEFISALNSTGYMMPLITITTLLCALLLFANRTALAAVILAPFTVNVILFHLFLDASPISAAATPAYILLVLNIYFLWVNRNKYKVLMQA